MKLLRLNFVLLAGLAAGVWVLHAQAPGAAGGRGAGGPGAPKGGPSPAIDFSGY